MVIKIRKQHGGFFAGSDEFNAGEYEQTEEKAIKGLVHFLIKDYLIYRKTPKSKLTKGAKRLLAKYEEWIRIIKIKDVK